MENATGTRQGLTFSELISSLKKSCSPKHHLHLLPLYISNRFKHRVAGSWSDNKPSRAAGPGLRIASRCWQLRWRSQGRPRCPPVAARPKWTSLGLCFATTLHTRLRSVKCQWRLNNSSAGGNPTPGSSSGTVQPTNSRYFSKLQSRLDVHFFSLLFSLFVHF